MFWQLLLVVEKFVLSKFQSLDSSIKKKSKYKTQKTNKNQIINLNFQNKKPCYFKVVVIVILNSSAHVEGFYFL